MTLFTAALKLNLILYIELTLPLGAFFLCSSACDISLAKSMEAVLSLLDKISSSETLRKKFFGAIWQQAESQQNVE